MQHDRQLRHLVLGLLQGIGMILLSGAVLLALVCVLVVMQGQRDDTRAAGAAIVLPADNQSQPTRAMLDHAIDLYRRGYTARLIIAGADTATQHYVQTQGLPDKAVLLDRQGSSMWEHVQNIAALTRTDGVSSVLLVGDAVQMLRALKMSHDLGLDSHASPLRAPGGLAEIRAVIQESLGYLLYVFARR